MKKNKISQEQKDLSDYVKGVHLSLRRKARQMGAEKAWEEHLGNEEVLRKYGDSLRRLSENHWSVNGKSDGDNKVSCRIEWIKNYIVDYFNLEMGREIEKEKRKMRFYRERNLLEGEEVDLCDRSTSDPSQKPPYKLLDVGSCHDPFGKYDFLTVFPIDLCPASARVKKCDFVKAEIKDGLGEDWFDSGDSNEIPSGYFDAVVFSLFLDYLPSPGQRYRSFVNAYKALKTNGLLLIATPDSRHETANSAAMKAWKLAAACIGFNRIRLEKLKYLYCMAFRKSISSNYPRLLYNAKWEEFDPEESIVVPQDSIDYEIAKIENFAVEKCDSDRKFIFDELPFL